MVRAVLTAALAQQRQPWEQGVLAQALLDLGEVKLARLLAEAAITRQNADGRLGEIDDVGLVNGAACGEAVRAVALGSLCEPPGAGDPATEDAATRGPATGQARSAERTGVAASALERQLAWLERGCPRAGDGTLFHLSGGREVWVDTIYMVVPLLVLCGRVDAAARQLAGHRRRLFDPEAGLYAHRFDDDADRLVRADRWGSGNGWVVAALARALRHLRSGRSGFGQQAAPHARDVLDACLRHRAPSGLFHDVLDDPGSFEEATLAAMLAYGVHAGVADGWLPERYRDVGRSLLETVMAHVDEDGLLRPACGSPGFDRPGTSTEGQAFVLLALAAAGATTNTTTNTR
jgi:unsaturated rhamnogalacturonyl hydrolase